MLQKVSQQFEKLVTLDLYISRHWIANKQALNDYAPVG